MRSVYVLVLLVLALVLSAGSTGAQSSPPGTDIFLSDLSLQGNQWKVGKPFNITSRQGYDNQPYFFPNGKNLLFTSIHEDGQADVYRYDISRKQSERLTNTPESEYSPTLTPDGKFFSVVRVEADKTQRLWKFPLRRGNPEVVLENIKPVGYHLWLDAKTIVVFVLGTPSTLQIVDVPTGKAEKVGESVGRCIAAVPRQAKMTFVHWLGEHDGMIEEMDIRSHKSTPLLKLFPENEFYAWTPDGVLITASGSKLYYWRPGTEGKWQEFADLTREGIKGISRLAVSPRGDRLAFVAEDGGSR